jgi:ABC-type multidrug transport system ATPase subunit
MSDPALLRAEGLRIDVDGAAQVENATFEARGRSLALLGDGQALIAAIAGRADVRSGKLQIEGFDVGLREQLRAGTIGLAPLDPPLPPRWTVRDYLGWGARLAGQSRTLAQKSADQTLRAMGLDAMAGRQLETLGTGEKRTAVLAQAIVTQPRVLVAASPLSGLAGGEADYVFAAFAAAARDRKWIASLSNLYAGSVEHRLAASADDLLVFASGRLVRQGKLQGIEEKTVGYTLMLRGKATEFREALRARGVELSGGPQRFFLELPPRLGPSDLLALSAEIGAPIIELVPRILLEP